MDRIKQFSAILVAAAALPMLAPASALAVGTAPRTFVSGSGSDSNPCTIAAPCRSFAGALAQTEPGGEIAVLDTAGYGPLTISQSVSIVNAGGVEAGITAPSGGAAIAINATATFIVELRGLTLEGTGGGMDGIKVEPTGGGSEGSRVEIVDCVIRDFSHDGIYIIPDDTTAFKPSFTFSITNTIASDNGLNGIDIAPTHFASVFGVIDQVKAGNNAANGISAFGSNSGTNVIDVAVSNTHADSNGNAGILATGNNVNVDATTLTAFANLQPGIVNDGGNVVLSNSRLIQNSGLNNYDGASGSQLITFQNSDIVHGQPEGLGTTLTATPF